MPTAPHTTFFSHGTSVKPNEDRYGFHATAWVVADGVTDKSGRRYRGKTGGGIVAQLVVDRCLTTRKTGVALVTFLNAEIAALYRTMNPRAVRESRYRFAATLVCARIVGVDLVVTQVNDASFRINGRRVYRTRDTVDELYANLRAAYITATGDIAGSRAFITPLIREQHQYQNNARSPLGYGVLDGTPTPRKYIRVFRFPLRAVRTLELFTDGYVALPQRSTIAAWEAAHRIVEKRDPHKYLRYPSTKATDDRTMLIVHF
jgi:hypothetical protein